ncbi:acetylornithine deacetylase [Tabrizicola sp. TH137]|uniref:acetylornithine deacetylase n=1 Tax=Tabrizicola sp. TH137 TaxID=2067452 RepID=UPI000C7AA4DD|nr:acetylornithine deacetylase [Tabrizicola sp. TH137]PLL12918.1 acetylornithine deacetylase [Tabrizicola sp. TH137]
MTEICPEEVLDRLVAMPCLPGQPNAQIADWIFERLRAAGLTVHRLPGPEGDRVNLLASIGPADRPGILLSGHMDVVPVEGQAWSSDPFRLTARDGRLFGRGTSDMKGFLACMIAAVPLFQAAPLKRPLHLAFSYDEEIGCRGVPHLIAALPRLCALPEGAIIGEPSALQPVLSHKGKLALELAFTGRSAHSSNPGAGVNALYAAAALADGLRQAAEMLALHGTRDTRFEPDHSTLVAGLMQAGTAVNIIPAHATLAMEVRTIPADSAQSIMDPILARAEALVAEGRALSCTVRELASYPALPPEASGLAELLSGWTGRPIRQAVSYGTEAGLFHAAGIPSIVCGPGDIARAHRPDEYITPQELQGCMEMLARLARHLSQ